MGQLYGLVKQYYETIVLVINVAILLVNVYINRAIQHHFNKSLEEYKEKIRKRRAIGHAAMLVWQKYRYFYRQMVFAEMFPDQVGGEDLQRTRQSLIDVIEEYAPLLPEEIVIEIDKLLEKCADPKISGITKEEHHNIVSLFREVFL